MSVLIFVEVNFRGPRAHELASTSFGCINDVRARSHFNVPDAEYIFIYFRSSQYILISFFYSQFFHSLEYEISVGNRRKQIFVLVPSYDLYRYMLDSLRLRQRPDSERAYGASRCFHYYICTFQWTRTRWSQFFSNGLHDKNSVRDEVSEMDLRTPIGRRACVVIVHRVYGFFFFITKKGIETWWFFLYCVYFSTFIRTKPNTIAVARLDRQPPM